MSLPLRRLLVLQLIYGLAGIAFNVVSGWRIATGAPGLTPNPPLGGIVVMSLFCLCLLPGWRGRIGAYRFLMGIAVLVLGWTGIVAHLVNLAHHPELYALPLAGGVAIAINLVGWGLNLIAATGRFRTSEA